MLGTRNLVIGGSNMTEYMCYLAMAGDTAEPKEAVIMIGFASSGSLCLEYKFESDAVVGNTSIGIGAQTNLCSVLIPPGVWLVIGCKYLTNVQYRYRDLCKHYCYCKHDVGSDKLSITMPRII